MTRRVHLLADTSGLSLRVEQVRADYPGAEAWVPEAELTRLREALRAEHVYWDAKAAADLRLQDAGEVAMDYPMPRRMTEAMRKADALAAALAALPPPPGGDDEGEGVG